jgi:plastocyanin
VIGNPISVFEIHPTVIRHRDRADHVREGKIMRITHFIAVSGLAVLFACGGSSPTGTDGNNNGGDPTPTPGVTDVKITDFQFSPASVTIKVGDQVRWTNNGKTTHNVVADDGTSFTTGSLGFPGQTSDPYGDPSGGQAKAVTFNTAGTFSYHCSNHPPSAPAYANFVGTVTVNP